jgi:uncharacterized damage-inducible protein DinB
MTTDPRYPIGKWARPAAISAADRAANIAAVAALPAQLRTAVAGLTDAQLDTPYREGGWTVRQLVHHVADSHLNFYTRAKLALTEDRPTIKPYEEEAWAQLADNALAITLSLHIVDAVQERLAVALRAQPEAAFQRPVVHPVSGEFTVDSLISMYVWHGRHHVAHITALRTARGW